MSENVLPLEKKPRTKEQLSQEYSQLAMQSGDMYFNLKRMEETLREIHGKMNGLVYESKSLEVAELASKSEKANEPS